MAIHAALGNGLDEKLYERALCIELAEMGIDFSQQQEFPVHYRSRFIGSLIPDLIVAGRVVVEIKVADDFSDAHASQIISYLRITKLQVGLLLNFKPASLKFKRMALGRVSSN